MSAPVLRIKGLTKTFGGLVAVNNVDFELPSGQLHAIIGPNGAGKTTLFNLISGMLVSDSGAIYLHDRDITGQAPHRISQFGIARTLQIKSVFNGLSVFDNVWIAAHSRARFLNPLKPASSYRTTANHADKILDEMGLTGLRNENAGNLSYGDVALLEMAIALATNPVLLLLDEPVAGMSHSETERMVARIKALRNSVNIILVEHDVEVVFNVAERITVMTNGSILTEGTPDQIAKDARVQEAYLGQPEEI
jgi:branched-chain amino acid transport system ATP-binding protein